MCLLCNILKQKTIYLDGHRSGTLLIGKQHIQDETSGIFIDFFYISDDLSWFQINLRFKIIQKCVELVQNVLFLEKKPTENNIENTSR